jgi:TIR domain
MAQRDIVFFSYNHNDSRWLAPIRTALEPYVLGQKLKVWSDRDIEVGSHWHDVIQNQLPRTRVAILLISQGFFASRYIREDELPRLLEDAAADQLALVCVSVSEVDGDLIRDRRLAGYQFAVEPKRPLSARRGNQRGESDRRNSDGRQEGVYRSRARARQHD